MVVTAPARALVDAVMVPDAQAWALWGRDLRALGFRPAAGPERAGVLIAPERIPDVLAGPVREAWEAMPAGRRHVALGAPWPGGEALDAVLQRSSVAQDGGVEHVDHGGDPMAIEGEPSADGLVMEGIDFMLGPLAPALPGGLVADISLDGDVVGACTLRSLLHATEIGTLVPDPLAPAAWGAVLAHVREVATGRPASGEEQARRVAAIEHERALSHAAWAQRLAAVLGWPELADRASAAVTALVAADAASADALGHARRAVEDLASLLGGGRRLRARTAGLGVVTSDEARELGLAGPDARASGAGEDARGGDPRYAALGFAAEHGGEEDGDALARITTRGREMRTGLELAVRALHAGALPAPGDDQAVEGPRGPLRAQADASGRPPVFAAPGPESARRAAAERAVGREWTAALTVLASFDLSPWAPPEEDR